MNCADCFHCRKYPIENGVNKVGCELGHWKDYRNGKDVFLKWRYLTNKRDVAYTYLGMGFMTNKLKTLQKANECKDFVPMDD